MVGHILRLSMIGGILVLTSGCGSLTSQKSPKELLSLSVAGLSGEDHYKFSGQTVMTLGNQVPLQQSAFQGVVNNHDQIQMKSIDQNDSGAVSNPLLLLKQVQETAQHIEQLPNQPDKRTSVLSITANENAASKSWANQLRNEFAQVEKKATSLSKLTEQHKLQVKKGQSEAAFSHEWNTELMRSKDEFNQMIDTLHVDSTYKLVLDRKHLVPVHLQEEAILHYKTPDGQSQKETRTTNISFQLEDSSS